MASRFVMANIKMPIEIKHDNAIVPLHQYSQIYIVSVIDSVDEVVMDKSLPDIITQAERLFQEGLPVSTTQPPIQEMMVPAVEPTQDDNHTKSVSLPPSSPTPSPPLPSPSPIQIWIYPEELHKTPPHFKKNASFKNHGKYNHRVTAKTRDYNLKLSK